MIFYVIILVALSIGFFALFLMFRNNWVYEKRIDIILKSPVAKHRDIIKQYKSYNEMLFRFWIWNIEKLRMK